MSYMKNKNLTLLMSWLLIISRLEINLIDCVRQLH